MSRKKKILAVCAALPILLILALVVVVHTYDYNRLKPRIESAVLDATGRELTLAGGISLDFGFTPALVVERVSLQNAPWGSRPQMLSCERFELEVALLPLITGDIQIKRLLLVRPQVLLEKSERGELNYQFQTAEQARENGEAGQRNPEEAAEKSLPGLQLDSVRMKEAEIVYRDHAAGSSHEVQLERMLASAESMETPMDFRLQGAFQEAPFSLSGEISSLQDLLQNREMPFDLRAELAGAEAEMEGSRTISPQGQGFSAKVNAAADSLDGLNQLAETELPGDLSLALTTSASSRDMQIIRAEDLELILGDSHINGEAEVDLSGSVPAAQADLSSDKLDLRPFMARDNPGDNGAAGNAQANSPNGQRLIPDLDLQADFLRAINASAQVQIKQLLLPEIKAENLRMNLDLAGGELRVNPMRMSLAGGSLEGVITLREQSRELSAESRLDLENIRVNELMAAMGHPDVLHGELEAALDVSGGGSSLASLVGQMQGEVSAIMEQARLDSSYLEKEGGNLLASLRQYLDPKRRAEEYTRINCLVTSFRIDNGVAASRVILLDTNAMKLLGNGELDLATERLDFAFDPSPKQELEGIDLNLSELSNPFKLSGTLAEPSLAFDARRATQTLGRLVGELDRDSRLGEAARRLFQSNGRDISCSQAKALARGEEPELPEKPEREEAPREEEKESPVERGLRELEEGIRDLF